MARWKVDNALKMQLAILVGALFLKTPLTIIIGIGPIKQAICIALLAKELFIVIKPLREAIFFAVDVVCDALDRAVWVIAYAWAM